MAFKRSAVRSRLSPPILAKGYRKPLKPQGFNGFLFAGNEFLRQNCPLDFYYKNHAIPLKIEENGVILSVSRRFSVDSHGICVFTAVFR